MRLKLMVFFALASVFFLNALPCEAAAVPTVWTAPVKLEGMAASRISAAWYKDQLHVVHGGRNNDELWHAWWDGQEWNRNRVSNLPAENRGIPALAVFQGSLHIVFKSDNNTLWHATSKGTNWTSLGRISGQKSYYSPSLVMYPFNPVTGEPGERLWMFHGGGTSDDKMYLWDSFFDGTSWSDDKKGLGVSQNTTSHCMYEGLLYRTTVYESGITFNRFVKAQGWQQASVFPQLPRSARSTTPVGLASDGQNLYAFYRQSSSGAGKEEPVFAAALSGNRWETPVPVKDFASSDGPVIVAVPGSTTQFYLLFTRNKDIYFAFTPSLKPIRPLLRQAN